MRQNRLRLCLYGLLTLSFALGGDALAQTTMPDALGPDSIAAPVDARKQKQAQKEAEAAKRRAATLAAENGVLKAKLDAALERERKANRKAGGVTAAAPTTVPPAPILAVPATASAPASVTSWAQIEQAAQRGDPAAEEWMGRRCLGEFGAKEKDFVCARNWLSQAASLGRPSAQALLASLLATSQGGPVDEVRAFRLYRIAAEAGDVNAQNNLGEIHETGRGVPQDPDQAILWYERAAAQGLGSAQFNSGRLWAIGVGEKKDSAKARAFLVQAEGNGVPQARQMLDWLDRQGVQKKAPAAASAAVLPAPTLAVPATASAPAAVSSWTPGKEFQDDLAGGGKGPVMVVIPAGSFEMGSNNDYADAKPKHTVRIGKPFAIGKMEVTQKQWREVMGSDLPELKFKGCDACPVDRANWYDAKEFIRRLNAKTGKTYRLPSEAEWEYACRAGVRQEYCGSDNEDSVAWYESNSGKKTHAVGQKQANAWGLYDMSGNVPEWAEDCWHDSYQGAPTDGSAWTSGCSENRRVRRGGSWYGNPPILRSTYRIMSTPESRGSGGGFRIARTLPKRSEVSDETSSEVLGFEHMADHSINLFLPR